MLTTEAKFRNHEAGTVASGMSQAFDKTRSDRIGDHGEYHRDAAALLLQWTQCRAAMCQYYIGSERDQLRCVSANLAAVGSSPANVDLGVCVNAPARPPQLL